MKERQKIDVNALLPFPHGVAAKAFVIRHSTFANATRRIARERMALPGYRLAALLKNLYVYCLRLFGCALGVGLIFVSPATGQSLIHVEELAFCQDVDRSTHQPVGIFWQNATVSKGKPLYFWVKVRGDDRALARLRAWHSLPIYYAWVPVNGGHTGLVDIGIKTNNWASHLKGLELEVANQGYFTWRTFGYSQHLWEGQWNVTILDSARKLVQRVPPPVNQVCRPEIKLTYNLAERAP
jgi:hypothetical protein